MFHELCLINIFLQLKLISMFTTQSLKGLNMVWSEQSFSISFFLLNLSILFLRLVHHHIFTLSAAIVSCTLYDCHSSIHSVLLYMISTLVVNHLLVSGLNVIIILNTLVLHSAIQLLLSLGINITTGSIVVYLVLVLLLTQMLLMLLLMVKMVMLPGDCSGLLLLASNRFAVNLRVSSSLLLLRL